MAKLFFFLLIGGIALQLVAASLEGRTSHYVKFPNAPVNDDSVQRITCPIYSIRPENQNMKYYKYAVSETQYEQVTDWTTNSTAQTFKACAYAASGSGKLMFMFEEDECKTSDSLFVRLAEPCADATATVVYMAEAPESSCPQSGGEGLLLLDGQEREGADSVCGSPDNVKHKCTNGQLHFLDVTTFIRQYGLKDGRCLSVGFSITDVTDAGQNAFCSQFGKQSCEPLDSETPEELARKLKDFTEVLNTWEFRVDLYYDSGKWIWRNTGIEHPTDASGSWANLPLANEDTKYLAYVDSDGLKNYAPGGIGSSDRQICCQ